MSFNKTKNKINKIYKQLARLKYLYGAGRGMVVEGVGWVGGAEETAAHVYIYT